MAVDKLVDSAKLDACLDAEADAIRAKTGGSADIPFDFANNKGFADAIASIQTGGGGATLLESGTYTNASTAGFINIPTGYTGSTQPLLLYAEYQETGDEPARSYVVANYTALKIDSNIITKVGAVGQSFAKRYSNNAFSNVTQFSAMSYDSTNKTLRFGTFNSDYQLLPGTFNWYIWG